MFVGAFNDATMGGIFKPFSGPTGVAFGSKASWDNGWTWVRTPNLTSATISGTTSNSGAIAIPAQYASKLFVNAVMFTFSGFVFRRDAGYFTVVDNDLAIIRNTDISFTAYFLDF